MNIEFPTKHIAGSVYSALTPDNVGIPNCMRLGMKMINNLINIQLDSECNLDTVISTAEDILTSCELSLKSIGYVSDR
jgi:tRNA threonylcarbamoyladenosine modification (KEOPS) complex  Pcc1 subunit